MRKTKIIMTSMLLATGIIGANAQTYWNGSTTVETTTTGGCDVGGNLTVRGGQVDILNGTAGGNIVGNGSNGWLGVLGGSSGAGTADGAYLQLFGNSSVGSGSTYIVSSGTTSSGASFFYQPFGAPSVHTMTVKNDGKVIIPKTLHVEGSLIDMTTTGGDFTRSIIANSGNKGLNMLSGTNGGDGAHITMCALGNLTHPGYMGLHTVGQGAFDFWNINGGTTTPLVNISTSGLYVKQGLIDMTTHGGDFNRMIRANSSTAALQILSGTGGSDGAYITMCPTGNPTHPGYMGLHTMGGGAFDFWNVTGGTTTPLVKINTSGTYVKQGLLDLSHGIGAGSNIVAGATNSWLGILGGTSGGGTADGAYLQLFGNSSGGAGSMYVVSTGSTGSGTSFFYQPSGATSVNNMVVRNDGKVIIGSDLISSLCGTTTDNTPGGYKLYVQDGILTERLKVANRCDGSTWADFVFNKDYDLMPLSKVEEYVKSNHHLPEIPSASEVTENGIDVAMMDSKLLQKIEELTLYVIEQNKILGKQQKQLEQQKTEIEQLKKKMY